ncbi:hypothetical protein BU17DRAFT_61639 [Hysterangium stoloniferum]|nr:hypothetical protein BU17DRAFT_61639 [Hysterangium stoloniferum]
MSTLAGRPPFATDDPDSFFDNQPKQIPVPRKRPVDDTAPGGPRESAYNTYDSYFTGNPANRVSGVGDIGRGFMTADSDFDDSSDDEQQPAKKQGKAMITPSSDKHRALFEAATAENKHDPPPPSYAPQLASIAPNERPQVQQTTHLRVVKQSQPVPHARGNEQWLLSQHAEPSTPPGDVARSMASKQRAPYMQPLAAPAPAQSRPPQPAFMQSRMHVPPDSGSPYSLPGKPSPRAPQPLPPPQTPIQPVFARPRQPTNITFDDKSGILRGNSEETLLPRGVGGKGDEFWRRFSMVAKEEAKTGNKSNIKSKSAWLRKTESGTTRLAAWVWVVGLLILIAIGGAVGVGWYFTHNKPAPQPVAIGGSAEQAGTVSTSSVVVPTVSTKPTRVTAAPVPTNTANNNQRRFIEELIPLSPSPDTIPARHRRSLVGRLH